MYDISKYLGSIGYKSDAVSDYRSHINKWVSWYQGKVKEFHNYQIYNGIQWVQATKKTLAMAKTVCEDWANLLMNERVDIAPEMEWHKARLDEILHDNNFAVRGNNAVEMAFSTGTAGFSEYTDAQGMPRVDCHDARSIWPLGWMNGEITDCAFSSIENIGGKDVIYMRIYTWTPARTQLIRNVFLEYESGIPVDAPEGIEPEIDTGITVPLFQIIKPNIANNIDSASPFGLSVFANAIDVLKDVDTIFDSFDSEYSLGRKRLIIPMSMAKQMESADGTVNPMFDPNTTVFYGMDFDDESQKPIDHSPEIRSEQHLTGLETALSLLSFKCGLGTNRYSFNQHAGVKTATEVVSEQSDLYQSLCKHELMLASALRGLARALLALDGTPDDGEIKISFDDSIIQDKNAIRGEARTDVQAGLMSKMRYLTDIIGMAEGEAQKELAQIASESKVSLTAVDVFGAANGG